MSPSGGIQIEAINDDYVAEAPAPGVADATVGGAESGQLLDGVGSLGSLGDVTGDGGLLGGDLGVTACIGGIDLADTGCRQHPRQRDLTRRAAGNGARSTATACGVIPIALLHTICAALNR